ncbi:DUF4145 domain-containing protein [Sutterella wadsworthensis]|uniref:DUF4145 domain-containing protein n=1 Tax=Sutterella wadsworthensis TaxID=40545 RepID=UPI00307E39B4
MFRLPVRKGALSNKDFDDHELSVVECISCKGLSIFVKDVLIYPDSPAIEPAEDMPEKARAFYLEAQAVIGKSPRSACALLRLCLEELADHLGGTGKNLYERIESLKLPSDVSDLFKACRLMGNQAAHPGVIDFKNDNGLPVARALSQFVNIIVMIKISPRIQAQRFLEQVKKS